MMIFDRFGELIFETNVPEKGWDGFYEGALSQQDVYIVKIIYTGEKTKSLKTREIVDKFTLIR